MVVVEQHVGKLLEVRYRPPLALDQLADSAVRIRDLVGAARAPVAICTDWRSVTLFDDDTVDAMVWTMRRDNPQILCNALLLSPGNTAFIAQVGKILQQAGNPSRRAFTNLPDLQMYVDPLLTASERTRLSAFFAAE